MKIATFADLHVGVSTYGHIDPNTGLNTRVLDALNSFDEIIDYCINNSIKHVIFAGDMFKNSLPSPTLTKEINIRIRRMLDNGILFYAMDGNHDVSPLLTAKSALEPLSSLKVSGTFHTRFEKEFFIDDYRILMLPTYTTQEEIENILSKYNDNKKTIVVGHFTALGAQFNDYLLSMNEDAIDCKIFNQKNILAVVLGHLHKYQILNKEPLIYYTGSSQRIDFNEENQKKGFVVLDINDDVKYEFIEIKSQEFLTIKMDVKDSEDPMQDLVNYIETLDVSNKIVRLNVTTNKDNNINDSLITKLLKDNGSTCIANINKIFDRDELIRNKNIDSTITEEKALEEYFKDNEDAEEIIKLGLKMISDLKENEQN